MIDDVLNYKEKEDNLINKLNVVATRYQNVTDINELLDTYLVKNSKYVNRDYKNNKLSSIGANKLQDHTIGVISRYLRINEMNILTKQLSAYFGNWN